MLLVDQHKVYTNYLCNSLIDPLDKKMQVESAKFSIKKV